MGNTPDSHYVNQSSDWSALSSVYEPRMCYIHVHEGGMRKFLFLKLVVVVSVSEQTHYFLTVVLEIGLTEGHSSYP